MNTLLFAKVSALTLGLVTAWLVAVRMGPDWLRPGHGPLWYLAAGLVAVLGAALGLLPPDGLVLGVLHRAVAAGTFNALVLALLLLFALFPILRALFGTLYQPSRQEPPIPGSFLLAGIAPDGSPLVELRWRLRGLLVVGLVLGALAIWAMDFQTDPRREYTVWAYSYAALLGCLLGSTHPVRPLPTPRRAQPLGPLAERKSLSERLDPLHRWLGDPPEIERLDGVERKSTGGKVPLRRFGLTLYGYQARILTEWSGWPAVALAGPTGTGRTTAVLLRAIDLALTTGGSCVVVTPNRAAARLAAQAARALLQQVSAGAALSLDDGLPPRPADLWVTALDDLEAFLDETVDPASHPLLQRLALVVVEDAEDLYGPTVARARFLVYRLAAARQGHAVQLLVTGNLPPPVLQDVAERIAAAPVKAVATAGERDPLGAASRPVRRFLVDPARIDHKRTSTSGLLGIRDGFARIVEEGGDEPTDRVAAELFGTPWQPWPEPGTPSSQPQRSTEAVLARVGPRSAWKILGQRRYYAPLPAQEGEAAAHEYLLLGEDPMTQLLVRQLRQRGTWWPQWFDTTRFPRILSAVPGSRDTPTGLQGQARRHLRAALDQGFHEEERLHAVFSPEIVRQVIGTVENTRIFERFEGWRPNPADPKRPHVVQMVRAQGAVEAGRRQQPRDLAHKDQAVLRDPSVGDTFEVPAALLELEYYDHALVRLRGKRYRIQRDPRRPQERLVVEDGSAAVATPIRTLRFARHGDAPLEARYPRYDGVQGLETLRGTVRLHLTHQGVHTFGYAQDDGTGGLKRLYEELLPAPIEAGGLVTRAWVICPPRSGSDDKAAEAVVLHTLTHVLRDMLDYFFLGASDFLGVAFETDLDGRAGVVVYDRMPDGQGCLDDIDDAKDLLALLTAAREVLAACDCEQACPRCCRSTSCTMRPHNQGLDRKKTLAVLDALLRRRG